jgi:Ca2+:H+ antiporter
MRYINLIGYVCIPLAYATHYWFLKDHRAEPVVTFILAALGVIPLAHLMGEATGHLAERTGPTWGGLLNATFGNAAELIIAVIALYRGLNEIVMASLTGSILGNLLLVAGGAILIGGWNREKQVFNRAAAEANAGLLVLAVSAMLFPAMFHFTYRLHDPSLTQHEHRVSLGTSVILLVVYGLGLLFTLRTHAHIFSPRPATGPEEPGGIGSVHLQWTPKFAVIMLLLASVGIGFVAELLVKTAEIMAHNLHWNPIFVGVILLAIIGNAAEHSTAILLAKRNDMDTAMTICYQSSVQIALFATPVVVLVSAGMASMHMGQSHNLDLIFSPMEVMGVFLAVIIVVIINMNGQTNWFEGVLLLGLYAILGIAFFYIPTPEAQH